jgi:hypothetical protein
MTTTSTLPYFVICRIEAGLAVGLLTRDSDRDAVANVIGKYAFADAAVAWLRAA